ncbi:hypothetical protein ACFSM5_07885 [Lacibacterium aquatile]|uniref:Uncharacterized protein n=1 Tax=Lacibacterium aquatile TaxID=1168082 RepID=A0ABW5DPW3_9PROT
MIFRPLALALIALPLILAACDDAKHTKLCSDNDFVSEHIYPDVPKTIAKHFSSKATNALGWIGAIAGMMNAETIAKEVDRDSFKLLSAVPTTKVGQVYGCRIIVAANLPSRGQITAYKIPFDVEFNDPFGKNPTFSYEVDFKLMSSEARNSPKPTSKAPTPPTPTASSPATRSPAAAVPAAPPRPSQLPSKTWEEKVFEGCTATETLDYIRRSTSDFARQHLTSDGQTFDSNKLQSLGLTAEEMLSVLAGQAETSSAGFDRSSCLYITTLTNGVHKVEVVLTMPIAGEPPRPIGSPSIKDIYSHP